ncbi:MAG: molybdenum cofactor guanylyltransferase [Candidatus Nanopelagicaceae bacterium]
MNFIVLSGGTSRRFGSDKSQAKIGDQTLLETLCGYLPVGKLIVVGPKSSVDAIYLREAPEFSGPVAAIGAAISEVESELVGIFATDMPFAPFVIPQLKAALTKDAALAIDDEGQIQPLAGIYRTAPLKSTLASFDSLTDKSMKSLISKLQINRVPLVETSYLIDIDTEAALSQAIALKSRLGL